MLEGEHDLRLTRHSRHEVEVDLMVEFTLCERRRLRANTAGEHRLVRGIDHFDDAHELHFEGGWRCADERSTHDADDDLSRSMHRAPRAALQRIGDGHPTFNSERHGQPDARIRREVGKRPADGDENI